MAKRCPSCGYGPIGPFSDNCPICAEPVRNVRSGGGSGFAPGGWSPVVKGIAIAAIIAFVLVGGCCGLSMWRMGGVMRDMQQQIADAQAKAEADRKARTVIVTAADLLADFKKDSAAADRKYQGKYLELTGVVERVGKERNAIPFVILHAGDEEAKVKVECFFEMADEPYRARLEGLRPGQTITVRGEYSGQVSNVQLRMCVFPDMPRPAIWGRRGRRVSE